MTETRQDGTPIGDEPAVPKAVIARLSLYGRELQQLAELGRETISSTQLGKRLGFTDAQVRKDLAFFGQFGYPGVGYRCDELAGQIRRILGLTEPWLVALVGVGDLGRALLRYRGFDSRGFRLAVAFDVDSQLVGQTVHDTKVYHLEEMPRVVAELGVRVAMLTVPASQAQQVAQCLADAGIVGILNFAPVTINLPDHVAVAGVDLAIELEQLVFAVVHRSAKP